MSRYYQLTHDYLVPALRQWLTRKQRETRRGRAELRLAERAAVWTARRENRHLPAWWEWALIRLYTRPRDWTPPQRQMMGKATWYHTFRAGVLLVLLALLSWGAAEAYSWQRASNLVSLLESTEDITGVPKIVEELSSSRRWANPLLVKMAKGIAPEEVAPDNPHYRRKRGLQLRVSLALLPVDTGEVEPLYQRMLEAPPDELGVLRQMLMPHYQELVPRLWAVLANEAEDPDRRFRAAGALALYDPRNQEQWAEYKDLVAKRLIRESPVLFTRWYGIFVAVRIPISESLGKIFLDPESSESERSLACTLLAVFGRGISVAWRIGFVLDAEDRPYEEVLLPDFLANPQAAALLNEVLDKPLPLEASEKDKDAAAKRQAHAAVALLQLDQYQDHSWPLILAERIWPLFRHGSDARLRTYLIHRLGRVGADPKTLIQQLEVERDSVARRALLLSLGEFSDAKLPAGKRQSLATRLLQTYHDEPDPGIHSAVDWLLRRWGHGEQLHPIDQERAGQPPGKRGWYVTNRQGHTLAVIRGPAEFPMGSPPEEPDRDPEESLHRQRIPRTFALATKEVTVRQFREFLQANPGIRHDGGATQKYGANPDGPMVGVTWFEAAQYCRWLSEQEGLPEDQRCYPPIAQIKEGMTMPADYLAQTGYRLPTEAEWEYACRAGAVTSRHYGVADEMLGNYARYSSNSKDRTWPVASKKPNDFGLFDMYGNAAEWCQDALLPYPPGLGGQAIEDRENIQAITASQNRVLRGGAFVSAASAARSAHRFGFQPGVPLSHAGLRVARTWR